MANLLSRIRRSEIADPRPELRSGGISFDQWATFFTWNGAGYSAGADQAMSMSSAIRQRHGTVASAVFARQLVLSQIRFVFRSIARGGDYGRLFGGANLARLEQPAPGVTRSTLLRTAEAHVSYGGNAFFHLLPQGGMELLRPDLVDVVYARQDANDDPAGATVMGYHFYRRGRRQGEEPEIVDVGTVGHWKPEPDPTNPHIGQSWVTGVMREIVADGQATEHIERFFQNAATPNAIIRPDRTLTAAQMREFQELFEKNYGGVSNAYKTWFIGGGSDVTVVGSKLGELALRDVQGGFETRIGTRSRVPASVLGIREGMAGSALNAGNYSATRRMWADAWFSPTVQDLCAALAPLVSPPTGGPAELWYDAAEVLFLQEDLKDAAEITMAHSSSIRSLTEAGYEPSSVVAAVTTGDLTKLRHTGVFSVQLQAPGAQQTDP